MENDLHLEEEAKLLPMDRWILSRLSAMVETVDEAIGKYDFHVATGALKDFLYYDFCDVYLVSKSSYKYNNLQSKYGLHKCEPFVKDMYVYKFLRLRVTLFSLFTLVRCTCLENFMKLV